MVGVAVGTGVVRVGGGGGWDGKAGGGGGSCSSPRPSGLAEDEAMSKP